MGEHALAEAAYSTRCFMRLVELGVPFPANEFGEYAGYKTDHDPRTRATSAGPLTSKYMTEALERSVRDKGIPVLDGLLAIKILTGADSVRREMLFFEIWDNECELLPMEKNPDCPICGKHEYRYLKK